MRFRRGRLVRQPFLVARADKPGELTGVTFNHLFYLMHVRCRPQQGGQTPGSSAPSPLARELVRREERLLSLLVAVGPEQHPPGAELGQVDRAVQRLAPKLVPVAQVDASPGEVRAEGDGEPPLMQREDPGGPLV